MTPKSPDTPAPRVALFAGSFDPFTVGHDSIMRRALPLFDRIIIAVGTNAAKAGATPADDRVSAIRAIYASVPGDRVRVIAYTGELTVDLARRLGARWLLRGVRSAKDFEYERDMDDINRRIAGIETVLLYALPELSAVSSSVVRELKSYGHDITEFLPQI